MQKQLVPIFALVILLLPFVSSAGLTAPQLPNEKRRLEELSRKLTSDSAKDRTLAIVQLSEIPSEEASKLLLRTLQRNLATKQGYYIEYGSYSNGNSTFWTSTTSDNGLLIYELTRRKYWKALPTLRKMLKMKELGISLEGVAQAIHDFTAQEVKYIVEGEVKTYPAPEQPADYTAINYSLRVPAAGEAAWPEKSLNKRIKELVTVLSIAGGPVFDRTPYYKALKEEVGLQTLLGLVKRGDPLLRPYAIRAVGILADYTDEVWAVLADTLDDKDPRVRLSGIETLGYALGSKPRPEILAMVVPRLSKALDDQEPEIRSAAIHTLSAYLGAARGGSETDSTRVLVLRLIAALNDKNRIVRYEAATALGQVDPLTDQVLPALIQLLKDPDRDLRSTAVRALLSCATYARYYVHGKEYSKIIKTVGRALLAAAADPAKDVRYEIAESLPVIRPDHNAVSRLIKMTRDPSRGVRSAAASSLGEFEGERDRIVPALVRMMKVKDEDPEIVGRVLRALGEFGSEARAATPEVRRLLKSQHERLRESAADTLEKIDASRQKQRTNRE